MLEDGTARIKYAQKILNDKVVDVDLYARMLEAKVGSSGSLTSAVRGVKDGGPSAKMRQAVTVSSLSTAKTVSI